MSGPPRDGPCFVYFAKSRISDTYKIGISFDPARRALALSADVVAVYRCDDRHSAHELEWQLHKRFARARVAGEWYKPTLRLKDLIEELARGGVAV